MVHLKSNTTPLLLEIKRLKNENHRLKHRKDTTLSPHDFYSMQNEKSPSVFEQLQVAIVFTDEKGIILKSNRKIEDLTGISKNQMVGKSIFRIYSDLNEKYVFLPDELRNFIKNPDSKSANCIVDIDEDSSPRYIQINVNRLFVDGKIQFCFICNDITKSHVQFRDIHNKYNESTLQLKEIHHRVKNNLQLISSLLNLEYNRHKPIDSEALETIIKESQNKIYSISLIHKNLYENNEFSTIRIGKYIRQLFHYIAFLYNKIQKNIDLELVDEVKQLPVKQSLSLGLIIDEVITNSFKHAFKNTQHGKIKIQLTQKNKNVIFSISDNGVGITNSQIKSKAKFGMELIRTMVKQINGSFEINNKRGTEYNIQFPM